MEERSNNTNHTDGHRGKSRKNSGKNGGKPYKKRTDGDKPYGKRDGDRRYDGERKSYGRRGGDKRYDDGDRRYDSERKSYGRRGGDRRDRSKRYDDRDGRGDKRDFKRDGERRDYGSRKQYDKRDGERRDDARGEKRYDRKPYSKSYGDRHDDGSRKPYNKRDGEHRDTRDHKSNGGRRDGGKRYADRDDRGGKRYFEHDRDRRNFGSRKQYDKRDRAPREEIVENVDSLEGKAPKTANQQPQERSFNRRGEGRSERKGDTRNGARNERSRSKVDMTTRRDLVQIATTDNSEDFVWAGAGLRHTDSEFFVMEGDTVIHEKYGEGEIVKIISGKLQVEFEDGKRWYAHPLAMEKGILRKPGVALPAEEDESATVTELESALDDEFASVLLAAGASMDDFSVNNSDAIDTFDDSDLKDGTFEEDDNLFDAGMSSLDLDFETIAVDDDATANMFADMELLTGVDFNEFDEENE